MTFRVKFDKADGSNIEADGYLTVIPEHSFSANNFDTTEVAVHAEVIQYELHHTLKCFTNTLLNYGKEVKMGQLTTCGWIDDSQRAK